MADLYFCPACNCTWGGYGRSPPYPHCPECGDAMMRQASENEAALLDSGFVPARAT